MKIGDYDFPDELYYHKEHCWARVEDDLVVMGWTDFSQKLAGELKRLMTFEEGDDVFQNKPLGTISSGKWSGKLYAPVSGEIEEVNEDVTDEPTLINEDPYGRGWILKIYPDDLDGELGNMMKTGNDFETWLRKEIEQKVK